MKKRTYMSPHACVVLVYAETILAGSGGLRGETSGADTPDIGDGGDADDNNPNKPDGGFEPW